MQPYQVLVDSSAWIDFFRQGNDTVEQLILEDLICTNEIILTELLPQLHKQGQQQVIELLESIVNIPLSIDWKIIREYQIINLNSGINSVGIPDLIILQQVIQNKITLYSLDKHFSLMREHLEFDQL